MGSPAAAMRSRWAVRTLLAVAGFLLIGGGAALAYFVVGVMYANTNYAVAQAGTLSAPTSVGVTEVSSTSAEISWTDPTPQLSGATYEVIRNPGSGQVVVCSGATGTNCTDTGLSAGTSYSYSVVAQLDLWTSSSGSKSFTTSMVSVGYPVNNTTYGGNWSGSISGSASPASNTSIQTAAVAIEDEATGFWWDGSSFNQPSETFEPATGTTSWNYGLAGSHLTSGHSYGVVGETSDSAGVQATSSHRYLHLQHHPPERGGHLPGELDHLRGQLERDPDGHLGLQRRRRHLDLERGADHREHHQLDLLERHLLPGHLRPRSPRRAPRRGATHSAASHLTSGDSYSVTAKATDSVGNTNTATNGFTYNTTVPSVTVAYPVNATTYGPNWSGTLSGTSASNAGSGTSISSVALTIENTTTTKYWNGSAFVSGVTTVTPTGTTGWSYSLAVSALTNANAYSVTAKATDSAGNTNTDINTFTYSTTAPSVAVSYPVSGTTYGANWSGTLTGSSSAANGATVSSVALTVEDTTNSTYWNGTTFQGTSTTVTPTGTTSWSDALAASALVSGNSYSVSATATDSATNTGTSATVTFTYNTTPPSVAVTYPVNSTTYGANWSGTLTGTSASNAGGGTSISSVALTIENTTNSTYWNGTSFASGTRPRSPRRAPRRGATRSPPPT